MRQHDLRANFPFAVGAKKGAWAERLSHFPARKPRSLMAYLSLFSFRKDDLTDGAGRNGTNDQKEEGRGALNRPTEVATHECT